MREEDQGPIVIYVGTGQPPSPNPVGWPALATRGFNATVYVSRTDADDVRLAQDMSDDELPGPLAISGAAYVTRLKLWRTPGAPTSLAINLGAVPTQVVAHLVPPADGGQRLVVCPAFPPSLVARSRTSE